ncbi:MAG: Smr/MutS family protein [Victivallales bacterium]|nr:Smr/MutS family protein [Victivallales bacterium]
MHHHFDTEIDLHGCHVDEAIREIERVLYRPKPQSMLIIHGNGTGALKKAVREFIAGNSYVRDYIFGEDINFPGCDGVVIVYT